MVFLPVKKIFCFILHRWRTAGRGGKKNPGSPKWSFERSGENGTDKIFRKR
jgi:hypothetical protein